MKKLCSLSFILALILIVGSSSFAQGKYGVIGKKFSKKEANAFFGKATNTATISKAELKEALSNAKNYIYFTIRNNKVIIMNGNKKSLLQNDELSLAKTTSDESETVYGFSTSVVEDFINSTSENTLTIEQRESVLSLSNNFSTLEFTLACPPICTE